MNNIFTGFCVLVNNKKFVSWFLVNNKVNTIKAEKH